MSMTIFSLTVLCVTSFANTLINGAGATFPYPLYSKWFTEYQKVDSSVSINYQSVGSGGGIRQLLDKTVDFGASDAPMTDEQMAKAKAPILHVPTVLGAVVVTYNLPNASDTLKLNADILVEVLLGKIKKWDDPKIKALNPKLAAGGDIFVVHRSDGSGTTAIFTDYLSKVSAEWKEKVGQGTAVRWPTGLGAKGNEGVTGLVKQTQGSIGYVELIYAKANSLSVAQLKNNAGNFVEPSLESVTEAAQGILKTMPSDFRVSITNSPAKKAYPISGFTYLLVYKSSMEKEKAARWVKFLKWSLGEGQKLAPALHYAPLPKSLIPKVLSQIETISLG